VPIYFGYEKVVESGSYLSELRGSAKRQERLMDLFTNIQVIRQHFGRLQVNLAPAIKLDEWLQQADITHQSAERQLEKLGQAIMQRINRQASINPVNLVALAITHRTHLTLQEHTLTNQVECYRTLSLALYGDGILTDNVEGAGSVIRQVAALGFIDRDPEEAWITCSPGAATLLTWYRNNVLHLFALPALIALLISRSTRGLAERALIEQVALIYPYVAQELTSRPRTKYLGGPGCSGGTGPYPTQRANTPAAKQTQRGVRTARATGQFDIGNVAAHVRSGLYRNTASSHG
jgi:glycerol-3-phosphate O-acyltransferase